MTGDSEGTGRRRFLEAAGATAAATSLAGCSVLSNWGSGKTRTTVTNRKSATKTGLSYDGALDAGYPTAGFRTFTHNESFSWTGTNEVHVFHLDEHVYEYGHGSNVDYPAKVLATPSATAGGAERNPTIADRPKELVSNGGPFEVPWLKRAGVVSGSNPEFKQSPRQVRSSNGPHNLLGNSEIFRVFESVVGPFGSSNRGDYTDAYVALARTVSNGEGVVVAVATGVDHGESAPMRRLLFLMETAMASVTRNPPTSWPDPVLQSFDDPRLVQTVSKTRVHETDPVTGTVTYHRTDDPDLVDGENAAPVFGLDTNTGSERVYFETDVSYANRSDRTEEFWLHEHSVKSFSGDQAAKFDRAARRSDRDDPPVFEVTTGTNAVTIRAETAVGYDLGSTTLSRGTDYSVADVRPLRVGFVTVRDPDSGSNYGGGNGVADSYDRTVDLAVEYLRRTYPGGLYAYRHRTPFRGARKLLGAGNFVDNSNAQSILENERRSSNFPNGGEVYAHGGSKSDAEREIGNHGFDVWVKIVPTNYYDHHGHDAVGLAPKSANVAVSAMERDGRRNDRVTASTVAQEVGHHFVNDPYDSPSGPQGDRPMAQRHGSRGLDRWVGSNAGGISTKVDLDHARHLDSSHGSNGPTDEPGVVSQAFDLTDGTYSLVEDFTIDPSSFDPDDKSPDNDARLVESFMSYSGDRSWSDAEIHQELIDSGWSGVTLDEHVFSAVGRVGEAGAVRFESVRAHEGKPLTEDVEDGAVEVALVAPDGETLVSKRVSDSVGATHVEGSEHAFAVRVPFPETVAEVRTTRGDRVTELNPVVRALRDAVERVPDRGFAGDADATRDRIRGLLDEVALAMDERVYGAAGDQLAAFDELVAEAVREDYEALAGQPARSDLHELAERMHERLAALAEY